MDGILTLTFLIAFVANGSLGAVLSGSGYISRSVALDFHNQKRHLHGVAPLQYSQQLEGDAIYCARRIISEDLDASKHPCNPTQGENIGVWRGHIVSADDFKYIANMWYNEVTEIDFTSSIWYMNAINVKHLIGHFTQMVWKGTSSVGCGWAYSQGLRSIVVCRYSPKGNFFYPQHLIDNVLPPADDNKTTCEDENPDLCGMLALNPSQYCAMFEKESLQCKKTCGKC